MSQNRILLAMDESENAMEAARYLARVLPPDNSRVVLFHVLRPSPFRNWSLHKDPEHQGQIQAGIQAWELQEKRGMEEAFAKARELLTAAGLPDDAISEKMAPRQGGVAVDVMAEADQGDYHAVVVGRRGQNQLKDMLLGGSAHKLISGLGAVPLCVVGKASRSGGFLAALDDSDESLNGPEFLAALFAGHMEKVVLFSALMNAEVFHSVASAYFPDGFEDLWLKQAEQSMAPVMEKAGKMLTGGGLDPAKVEIHYAHDVPSRSEAIVKQADALGCGSIVLGRRGMTRAEEFFLGRVSQKVVHLAKDHAVWVVG